MNVTLKPETEKLIREHIDRGDFHTADEMVEEAIQYFYDSDRAEAELEELVEEGLNSGPTTETTRDDIERLRREFRIRKSQKQG